MSTIFFSVSDKDIAFLKERWDDLLSLYAADKTSRNNAFQALVKRYSEKGRFYHNLSHVKALLDLFESLEDKIQNHNAVKFSIWFHDIVYNAKRNDNEKESAKFAYAALGILRVNAKTRKIVRDLILATQSHDGKNLSADAKLFLDMDLAILGAKKEIYKKYSGAIREEYSWADESMYRAGRKKALMSFMERESIYFTDEMKKRFDKQAKKNMDAEIKSLGAKRELRPSQ